MSSTDKKIEKMLSTFYDESFAPAAQQARKRGVLFLASSDSTATETYFTTYEPGAALFEQIEPDQCQEKLASIWSRADLPELAELAPKLFALAPQVAPKEADEDLSPFMYVMF